MDLCKTSCQTNAYMQKMCVQPLLHTLLCPDLCSFNRNSCAAELITKTVKILVIHSPLYLSTVEIATFLWLFIMFAQATTRVLGSLAKLLY